MCGGATAVASAAKDLVDDEQGFLDTERFPHVPVEGMFFRQATQAQFLGAGTKDHFHVGVELADLFQRHGPILRKPYDPQTLLARLREELQGQGAKTRA